MIIKVSKVRSKMHQILQQIGYAAEDVDYLTDVFLGGELRGHTSHGLIEFIGFTKKDFTDSEDPEILLETSALYIVDVKSGNGDVHSRKLADKAILMAKKEAMSTVLVKNLSKWTRPGAIAEYIAKKDLVAIVINSGAATLLAPPGGFDPMLGTNPIAYGVPTNENPLVVDLATSEEAWGQVRLANKYGTDLPDGAFYDDKGDITTDPQQAYSVMSFGGYKGFSLAFMIEILCGSLVGMQRKGEELSASSFGGKLPDRAGMIIVIDPSRTTGLTTFKANNTEILKKINKSQPLSDQQVRVPGEHSGKLQKERLEKDEIEIANEVWREIQAL